MGIIASVIYLARNILELLVIVSVLLSYVNVMDRFHPVRRFIDAIVEPMLMPIRRVVPLIGMFDISPIILIVLIRIISNLIINLL